VTPVANAVTASQRRAGAHAGGVPWSRVAGLVLLLGLAFVVSRSCQQSGIRIDSERAIGIAKQEVAFPPVQTQVRLLRQGLGSKPYWVVSLSIPAHEGTGFRRLAVVRVDADSGEVAGVSEGRNVAPSQRLRQRSAGDG
jgi:hypothetical protein